MQDEYGDWATKKRPKALFSMKGGADEAVQ
jgi:hypothetical protein